MSKIRKLTTEEVIKAKVDSLVSDFSGCDRDGCRCWQSNDYLRMVAEYAQAEFEKHGQRTHAFRTIEEKYEA